MQFQSGEELLEFMRGFQGPCVLGAAADLDVFNLLAEAPRTAAETAVKLRCDVRGMTILLDALSSMGVLVKTADRYEVAPALASFLVDASPQSVAAMLRHHANCLRRWSRLAWVVQSGGPADAGPSVRGPEADQASFIEAMNVVSNVVADGLIREINPGGFRCVLDVGGASGTWTLAWLKAEPAARAIVFDLPAVTAMARERIEQAGFAERVDFAAGDFYTDPLPGGADLVWLSAIIHQNSRDENRALFESIARSIEAGPPLGDGGLLLIRDVVLDESRTTPPAGAMFAVNMLVATAGGNSYTLSEICDDLTSAGFSDVKLIRPDEGMHSIVSARYAP